MPLTVLSSEDIARQGPQDLTATLLTIPPSLGAHSNGEGRIFCRSQTTLDLFGLGEPEYMLRARQRSTFQCRDPANIANIPASAIDRIEILKDGGSSIYGSDAVAGVVNIILNRELSGDGGTASYGQRVFWATTAMTLP